MAVVRNVFVLMAASVSESPDRCRRSKQCETPQTPVTQCEQQDAERS
jgi:hypothetical protein